MKGIERAAAIFPSKAALARASGRHAQEINRYLKRGWVTADHCQAIAAAVDEEIPHALERGVDPTLARSVSLHELNTAFPAPADT
jgi:DNA-binding transcriptional regulator YdaS (Cro superfamily)